MDKCIVVTGAEGFLGCRVIASLAAAGPVIAVDRVAHSGPVLENVIYHQADLADASTLLPASMQSSPAFQLIHLAWDMRRHQGYAIQAEQVKQFAGLLDYWTGRGLEKLVAMGSAEEYGGLNGVIHESVAPELPLSPYGWAKRSAHDLADSWCEKYGKPVAWFRPFIIYGPGQKGDMMIPYAIECARNSQKAQFTDGKQKRDFVYIDDVVTAITMAANKNLSGFQSINLGRGEPVSVADVLMTIARHYDMESQFELGARPRRPGEPDIQIADTATAKEMLGWEAAVDWRTGLARTMDEHGK